MNIEECESYKEFHEECEKMREKMAHTLVTNEEYDKLIFAAITSGEITIEYIMRVLKETGIRYGNLKDVTVEAVKNGTFICETKDDLEYEVTINEELQKDLLEYCNDYSIQNGIIFTNKNGKVFDTLYFKRKINKLAEKAELKGKNISIHAFRHLYMRNILEEAKKAEN